MSSVLVLVWELRAVVLVSAVNLVEVGDIVRWHRMRKDNNYIDSNVQEILSKGFYERDSFKQFGGTKRMKMAQRDCCYFGVMNSHHTKTMG